MTSTPPTTTFGDRLRVAREAVGVTREKLAVESMISCAALTRTETGRTEPTRATVLAILLACDRLGIDLEAAA
ncbi:MAG TPA: helix-turn-helix transcriptional regulator [Solirubrobacteraceae bacterium]|nr:helix-turn-helix transcriptional regulator [Solirubrobacteraceae bacterium]